MRWGGGQMDRDLCRCGAMWVWEHYVDALALPDQPGEAGPCPGSSTEEAVLGRLSPPAPVTLAAHLPELALLLQSLDVAPQQVMRWVLQLKDADQGLHQNRGAVDEQGDSPGLQLYQLRLTLQETDQPVRVQRALRVKVVRTGEAVRTERL